MLTSKTKRTQEIGETGREGVTRMYYYSTLEVSFDSFSLHSVPVIKVVNRRESLSQLPKSFDRNRLEILDRTSQGREFVTVV